MGGKGGGQTEVTEYGMSMHYGVCVGPVDAFRKIIVKEKEAWSGTQAANASLAIDQRDLFGGNKKEGGVAGIVTFLLGAADQLMPDWLAAKLGRTDGANCPAYRGIASVFFTGGDAAAGEANGGLLGKSGAAAAAQPGFYWTANNPYLPGVWTTVQRAPVGLTPGLAMIEAGVSVLSGARPWRYLPISIGDATNRAAVDFDDSTWLLGTKPFGNNFEDVNPSVTVLSEGSACWLRCHVGDDVTGMTFWCDDVAEVWYNGVSVGTGGIGEAGNTVSWTPGGTGDNVLAVRFADTEGVFIYWNDDLPQSSTALSGPNANPAHIIYECLTNPDWGMGSPTVAIDTASFEAAAQTLFDEAFGLSMLWTRQASIENFVQEVLDHIQAVLFVDPSTGLLTLVLIRGDYDAEDLPIISPDNADLTGFSRKLWGEIVNEIIVTWTNPENEQDETITVQDLASMAIQGGPVSDSRNYYGVRNAELAQQLGWRDLMSAGQPLASCTAEVNRTLWRLRPASVVAMEWPEYGLDGIAMRVTSIDYGRPGDMTIKLELIEDVYGLDIGDYETPPASEWVDPSADPVAVEDVEIVTLPLFLAARAPVAAFVDSPEYPEVVAGVMATTEAADTFGAELWDEVTLPNGSTEWRRLANLNIVGRAELGIALEREASSTAVTFTDRVGQTLPVVAGFAIIGAEGEDGNEIAMIDAADYAAGEYTLTRGVLDTVPRAWPVGTVVRFVDGSTLFEDALVRSSGEIVDYKIRSQTSKGLLPLESAPLETYTLTDRPWLPNRPAKIEVYGAAWTSASEPVNAIERPDPWVTVTWANRNRLLEDSQVLSWGDAEVVPETGQTTTIEVLPFDDDTPIATHDGLTGTSFDVPDASFGSEEIVRLRFSSVRTDDDGEFVSLQFFDQWVQVAPLTFDSTRATFDNDFITMDQG